MSMNMTHPLPFLGALSTGPLPPRVELERWASCGVFLTGSCTTIIWGSCENKADFWGPDPMDSVDLGVAPPFYQVPRELVLQVVLGPPRGFETRPIGLKPIPAHLPFCIYNPGFL